MKLTVLPLTPEQQPMSPLPNPTCPLCGRENDCQVARCGRFDVDCWCRAVAVSPQSLAIVPPAQRNLACLCRHCAETPPESDMLAPSSRPARSP